MAIDARYDSCALADFDHDGRIDLYVNGTVTGGTSYRDYLFRNTGTRFEEVTPEAVKVLESDHGAQWHDFDGDGDADLALTGVQPTGMHHLLRNDGVSNGNARSVRVRVVDANGRATRAGAVVRGMRNGRAFGAWLVDGGSGYDSQNAIPVHLTLDSAAPLDLEVAWRSPTGERRVARQRVTPAQWVGRTVTLTVP